MGKIALVTGGGGFIGSHLVDLLLQDGWDVRVLDNFSSGTPDNLAHLAGKIKVFEGDIRNPKVCSEACLGIGSVFHLAGMASVGDAIANPLLAHEVNLTGTLNMLIAARDAGVSRFVFSSSTSVYGNANVIPTNESALVDPLSPYASQKASGELYCRNFYELYGLESVILRYFNVFGPRQSVYSGYAAAIPKFVQAAITDGNPVVFGDGLQTRDFVYAGNVASANLLAATAEGVAGETFNIAGGCSISLLDLLEELRVATKAALVPEFREARPGDVRHSRADITRARTQLGYEPTISLSEGLRRTVRAAVANTPVSIPAEISATVGR